jgi:hypothetical protein
MRGHDSRLVTRWRFKASLPDVALIIGVSNLSLQPPENGGPNHRCGA